MCIINPRSSIDVNQLSDSAFDRLSSPVVSMSQYYHVLATSRQEVFEITQDTFQQTEGITRTKLDKHNKKWTFREYMAKQLKVFKKRAQN